MYDKKSRKIIYKLFGFVLLILLISCAKDTEKNLQQAVSLVDSIGMENILSELKGNVVVVNVWATWCSPCIEEFPDLVKLAAHYESGNVKLISISVDYGDEIDTKILPFLKTQNVNFPVYVQNYPKQEMLINHLNDKWSGAIPATFIYNKAGIQVDFMLGKHSFAEFKSRIEKYL